MVTLKPELWSAARAEQEAREEADPWDEVLSQAVGTIEQDEERIFSRDLLETVLGIHPSKQRDIDAKRLGRCMRRLGWDGPKPIRISNTIGKGYVRST